MTTQPFRPHAVTLPDDQSAPQMPLSVRSGLRRIRFGRHLAKAMVVAAVVLGAAVTPVSATSSFNGPLYSSIISGSTICESISYGISYLPGGSQATQSVRVESTAVVPTRATVSFGVVNARRTLQMWSRPAGTTTFRPDGPSYVDWATFTLNSTNMTIPTRTIGINAGFRGEIAMSEKIELLDRYGRVISGGTWGPYWENEYWSVRFGYGIAPTWSLGCKF